MGLYAFTLFCQHAWHSKEHVENPYKVHEWAFSPMCVLVYDPYYWYEVICETVPEWLYETAN